LAFYSSRGSFLRLFKGVEGLFFRALRHAQRTRRPYRIVHPDEVSSLHKVNLLWPGVRSVAAPFTALFVYQSKMDMGSRIEGVLVFKADGTLPLGWYF
jgi:hypothetical protein